MDGLLKKVIWITLAFVLLVAMSVFIFFWNGSLNRVLLLGGFSEDVKIFDQGRDAYGYDYRAVVEFDRDNNPKMAFLIKNSLRAWEISHSVYPSRVTPNPSIGWINTGAEGTAELVFQRHKAYIGNDAVKDIHIPEGMLPADFSVEIYQEGRAYLLHLVAYTASPEEVEQWKNFDIIQMLREAGYLSE